MRSVGGIGGRAMMASAAPPNSATVTGSTLPRDVPIPGTPMPLTDAQRKHLEQRLLEERARVVEALQRYDQESGVEPRDADGDLSAMPLHMADVGTDNMQRELDASLASRESSELSEIDEALRRLYHEPETYGRCERTGADIPYARLEIIPWARTCDGDSAP